MNTLKITQAVQDLIDIIKTPYLIVNEDYVVGVYNDKEHARTCKKEDKLAGKIVAASSCEFEVVDLAAGVSDLPDETITPEDEAEVAVALDAEEITEQAVVSALLTQAEEEIKASVEKKRVRSEAQIAAASESKKLDRRIVCLETAEVFKSAFAMFTANPTWMNIGQRNKMTTTLLNAAKAGNKIVVEVNGRSFELLNVGG